MNMTDESAVPSGNIFHVVHIFFESALDELQKHSKISRLSYYIRY